MKEPEEYLGKACLYSVADAVGMAYNDGNSERDVRLETVSLIRSDIIEAIKQAQIDAWNEAVEACADSAVCLYFGNPAIVDKQSILKLNKLKRFYN